MQSNHRDNPNKIYTISSTSVRAKLKSLVSRDAQDGDIHIEMNGEPIAILTHNEPKRKIPPLRLKIADAKNDWANILALVIYRNAVFKFKLTDCDTIYLIRDHDQYNPQLDQWNDHVKKYRFDEMIKGLNDNLETNADAIECQLDDLKESVENTNKIVRQLFTMAFRNGNILATPESGLIPKRSAEDLDRFEID